MILIIFLTFLCLLGVYYINAIENAASAMEMSALSAVNSALLAKNHLAAALNQRYFERGIQIEDNRPAKVKNEDDAIKNIAPPSHLSESEVSQEAADVNGHRAQDSEEPRLKVDIDDEQQHVDEKILEKDQQDEQEFKQQLEGQQSQGPVHDVEQVDGRLSIQHHEDDKNFWEGMRRQTDETGKENIEDKDNVSGQCFDGCSKEDKGTERYMLDTQEDSLTSKDSRTEVIDERKTQDTFEDSVADNTIAASQQAPDAIPVIPQPTFRRRPTQ